MKILVFHVMVLLASVVGAASTWYVDVNRTGAADPSGRSEADAFGTIKAAISAASSGDTIVVLPGEYGEGEGTSTSYEHATRVVVSKNVTLRSRDGAGTTHIVGRHSASAHGMGSDGIRCIAASSSCTISGFTIRDGASNYISNGTDTNGNRGGGIFAVGSGVVVTDCVISNCVGTRGGAAYLGTFVRCVFTENRASTFGAAMRQASALNCLFTRNRLAEGFPSAQPGVIAYPRAIVNCTVANNPIEGFRELPNATYGPVVNTVVLYNKAVGVNISAKATYGSALWRYCVTDNASVTQYGTECKKAAASVELYSPAADDYRPVSTSVCVNAASIDLATNYFARAYIVGANDLAGVACCDTNAWTMNIGAFQGTGDAGDPCLVISVATDRGVTYAEGRELCAAQGYRCGNVRRAVHVEFAPIDGYGLIAFSRSDTGMEDWPLESDDVYMLMPTSGVCTTTIRTGAVKYVDAEGGDAANADGSALKPYCTLDQATRAQNADWIIVARDGTYSNGVNNAYSVDNRFVVSSSYWTRLRSEHGANNAFIVGAPGAVSASGYMDGEGAVRCAALKSQTQLQGFTITGGHAIYASTDLVCTRGGGVYFASEGSEVHAAVTDCIISNCVASRGAAIFGGTFERCLITKNIGTSNGVLRNCRGYSSIIAENEDPLNKGIIGYQVSLWQCTVANNRSTQTALTYGSREHIYASIVADTRGSVDLNGNYSEDSVVGTSLQTKLLYGSILADPLFADVSAADYRVCACSSAARHGKGQYLVRALDFNCKPYFIYDDGSFTVGALRDKVAGLTGSSSNIAVVSVSPAGWTAMEEAGNVTFTATKASERHLLGFDIGGEFVPDDGTGAITFAFDPLEENGDARHLNVTAVYDTNWYVDGVNGSDSNTGFSWNDAKRTLAAGSAKMEYGDTLNVGPGTYDSETMLQSDTSSSLGTYTPTVRARLVVSNGCRAVAREGYPRPVIKGAPDTTDSGLGPNAVRGVYLGKNASISGFIVTGGYSDTGSSETMNTSAGGIAGYDRTVTVTDCIISNNVSHRGGGMRYGVCRRCVFTCNSTVGNCSAARNINAYHCLFDDNRGTPVVGDSNLYNCTIGTGNTEADGISAVSASTWVLSSEFAFVNTVIAGASFQGYYMTNCAYEASASVLGVQGKGNPAGNVNPAIGSLMLNTDGTLAAGSVAIDAGDAWLIHASDDSATDLGGGQRIYNNAMDVGCYEFDWRPAYGKILGRSRTSVIAAPPASVAVPDGFRLLDGDVDVVWAKGMRNSAYYISCVVQGTGVLTVLLNGESIATMSATDGARTLQFNNALESNAVRFSYESGDGDSQGALVASLARGARTVLMIR